MKNAIILAFFMATMPMVAVAQQLSDSVYESFLKTESIEILDDHLSVEVVGVKLALMRFVVARDVQLVVMNNDGMAQLNELTLPEPLDQFCIQHCPSIQFRKRVFDEVKIDSMAFWKRVNGQFDRYPMHCVYEKNQILSHELRIGNIGSYRVSVDGLKPGDTIRLFYSLNFPFNANWTDLFSLRMFHHSSWPRRQYSLSWKYNQRLDVDTTFYKARPAVSVNSGLVNFEWNMKNLPGALDEPNAHPYCDLPWFVFSPKPADLLRLQYTTFDQEYIPAWMMMSALRENDVIAAKVAVNQGVRTPDFSAFNRLADTMMQKFPDDQSGRQVLSWFQKFMVDEVRYDSDIEYYKNHVNYLRDKPGRDLAGRLLRDRNRLTAYSNMILRLHLQFLTAFPMDKRCGIISPKYFSSIPFNDYFLLSVLRDSTFAWIYPKSDLANYLCDEMPFYFENTRVMLQVYSQRRGYKRDMDTEAMFFVTPGSKANENYRKVNSMVHVGFEKATASFQTRVSLSGQYSTMTRHIYRGLPADSTINPYYHLKVYDVASDVQILKTSSGPVADAFPFLTTVTSTYEYQLPPRRSDTLTIDLMAWVMHVVVDGIDPLRRYTAFHADFLGSDTWSYMVQFDVPVALVSANEPIDMVTDFGQYSFSIKQLNEKQVLVNSYFLTRAMVVEADKIDQVTTLFSAMKRKAAHLLKVVKSAE